MLNYSTLGAEYSRVPNKQIFEGYRINLSWVTAAGKNDSPFYYRNFRVSKKNVLWFCYGVVVEKRVLKKNRSKA